MNSAAGVDPFMQRISAVPGCFGTGGEWQGSPATGLVPDTIAAPSGAVIGSVNERIITVRVCFPSGARGFAVAYALVRNAALPWTVAQPGRAAVNAEGRRFESGPSTTG